MAATSILAPGTAEAASSEITITTTAVRVCMFDATGPRVSPGSMMFVQVKDPSGHFFTIDVLTMAIPSYVLDAPGVYRVYRPACANAVGAFTA